MGTGDGDGLDELVHGESGIVEGIPDPSASVEPATSGPDPSATSGPATTVTRPRGRPRKPAAKPTKGKARRANDSEPVRLRVDQGPRVTRPVPPQAGPAGDVQAALMSATLIVGMCEQMVVGSLGPHAALNAIERPMIVDPAARILARSDADALAKYAAIMDPITLAAGLAIWGFRVWSFTRRQETEARTADSSGAVSVPAEQPSPVQGQSAAGPAPSTNGHQAPNGVAPVPLVIAAHFETDRSLEGF